MMSKPLYRSELVDLRKSVARFLDLITLQFLNGQSMYGYQMIIKIRKTFGVYLSPSTIYTLLRTLEKKGFVKSDWIICERPRRVYNLTVDGQNMLKFTEDSLTFIFKMSKFGKLVEGLNGQDGNGVSKPIKEDYSS